MVSVIIPVFNREKTIKESITSVLNQTYNDFEIIIVDDFSTDKTTEVIENINDTRIHLIKLTSNHGACYARNIGIIASCGDIIAFHDSDDLWDKNKLKKCMDFMEKNNIDILFHAFSRHFPNGKTIIGPQYNLNNYSDKKKMLLFENCINTPALVGRKYIFEDVKFDEKMPKFQDWDIGIRLAEKYDIRYLDEILVEANVDNSGLTMNMKKSIVALKRIMQKNPLEFSEDKFLRSKYYRLMGDFNERDNGKRLDSMMYYRKALQNKFNIKILLKFYLSFFGIYRLALRIRKKIKISY